MRTPLEFFGENFKWIILLFICLFLFFQVRNCREQKLNDEIMQLKGKVDAGEKALVERDAEIEKLVKEHDEKIAELNGHIDSANTIISGYMEEDAALKEKITGLKEAVKTITNKDDLIAHLTKEVFLWESRFSLAEKTIAEKDRIIFSLAQEYESEKQLRLLISDDREAWKRQYADLKILCDKLEVKVAHTKTQSLLYKTSIVLLGGLAVYSLAK